MLTAQGHAQSPHISAAVKRSQADRMLARAERRQVDRIPLVSAIGNPIFGKQRSPGRAVNAEISLLIFPVTSSTSKTTRAPLALDCGDVSTRKTGGVLSMSTGSLMRSPDSDWPQRIIGRVRSDDLDDVTAVGECGAIDRVKVVAQFVF